MLLTKAAGGKDNEKTLSGVVVFSNVGKDDYYEKDYMMKSKYSFWILINVSIFTLFIVTGFVLKEWNDVLKKLFQLYIFFVCSASVGYFFLKNKQNALTKTLLGLWFILGLILLLKLILGHGMFLVSILYVFVSFILGALFRITEKKK